MRKLILGAAFALLAACAPDRDAPKRDDVPAFKVGDITVTDLVVAAPIAGRDITAAYMTIRNSGAADRLVSVESPGARLVEIHTHEMGEGGMMKMRRVDGGLPLPPGETAFKPGGLHLMVFGLLAPEATDVMLPLHLEFEKAGPLDAQAPFGAPSSGGGH